MNFNPELCIMKLFVNNRDAFENYYGEIKNFKYDTELKQILNLIFKYYEKYQTHNYIGSEELKVYYDFIYPVSKNKEIVMNVIDVIYTIEVSDSIIKDLIKNMVEKEVSLSVIEKLSSVITENKYGILSTISDDVARYEMLLEQQKQEDIFVTPDIEFLLNERKAQSTLQWRLKCLQEDLKNIGGGILGHIFARPETGKTSLISSEITHIVRQLAEDECAIWCNNEQEKSKILMRSYTSMLNKTEDVIINNITQAKELYMKSGGSKLKIYDNAFISIEMLRKMAKTYKPRILIVDQGDKVSFSGATKLEGHARLKELYVRFREIAKEFNIHILTVGQASGEAAGKKWLEMHHMDNSKTGKPGEMDYIIGVGKSLDGDDDGLRYINLCKNKLTGKHSRHVVQLLPAVGRYRDI